MTSLLQNGKGRLYRLLAVGASAVVLCMAAYYVVFSANGLMVYREKRRISQDLERQIKSLQQQSSATEAEIKALKTDPKMIEKEARERFHYSKPGEIIYSLPATPAAAPTAGRK